SALQDPTGSRHRRRRDLLVGDGGHRGNHSYADVVEVEEAWVVAEGEPDRGRSGGGGGGEGGVDGGMGPVVGHAEDSGPTHRGGEVVGGAAVALEPEAEDVLLPGDRGDVLAQGPVGALRAQGGGEGAGVRGPGIHAGEPGVAALRPAAEVA